MPKTLGRTTVIVFGVQDTHGRTDYAVVSEPADSIQICGMYTAEGTACYFESEAYHLEDWCNTNGFEFIRKDVQVEMTFA